MVHLGQMIYTLVPLGNPGKAYEITRHNAARIVLERIKDEVEMFSSCEIFIPDTYMNESGKAVAEYLRYHDDRELIVMYDDKDLPLGTIRISHDRGDGGHNGVKSVIESLGTREFVRVRLGIAPKDEMGNVKIPQGEDVQNFVMGKFLDNERVLLEETTPAVTSAIKDIVALGYQKAMEKNN
ncbi:MAG: peptidyl-tRNA hydrolase, family [Patescibacteria group bacterium]|nr:peptidyl-tRNA hydrolase, family [Patescibacteria group bacterium]